MGAKNFCICSVFRRLRDLMANVYRTKRYRDNRARMLARMKGLVRCLKISWTLVHKHVKTGPEFLPILTILFYPSPSHTLYAALTWRPTATLNETALGSSAAQIWSPKRCWIGNAIASGGLKWQYIAIIASFLVTLSLTNIYGNRDVYWLGWIACQLVLLKTCILT